jgi:tRNA(Ile)-lysidine synthase
MISPGDKIIVGVSGGPDSICLLHVLNEISNELHINIAAVHINHCLRGKDADEDEAYVKEFCKKINIEFYSKRIDINKLSESLNISCETAGRKARYDFFDEIMKKTEANKIAIAHNANDVAETILMRIMRGTGLEGLIGIKPVRENIYIRPLINTTREEIENYCKENNLEPRIDKTNLQNIYSRNKIRLELIPYIRANFNNDIVNVLNRMSNNVASDNDFLLKISHEKYEKYCDNRKEKVIISREAFSEHEAILSRIIRESLYHVNGNLNNFDKMHIMQIIKLQKQSTGKIIILPNDIMVINNYGCIEVKKRKEYDDYNLNKVFSISEGKNVLSDLTLKITTNIIESNNFQLSLTGKSDYIKYFDYDKIKNNINIRYRREGDRFSPLGMNGSRKLKDIFIDMKIPKEERNKIPLLCSGEDIAWIIGYRISEKFKIDSNTKKIMEINIEREENI